MLEYQQERLQSTLRHAIETSPYYRKVFGKRRGDIPLESLPVLTKQCLMQQWDRIVTDPELRLADAERHIASQHATQVLSNGYNVVASGGTTGTQCIVAYDRAAWEIAVAVFMRTLGIQEVLPETRAIGIGSPSPLHMSNRLFGALRAERQGVPKLALTTPLPEVVTALNAYQPEVVITYPSFIRRLAEEQQAGRLRIEPRKFCSCAETLTQDVRDIARDTWNAAVLNVYAATEVNVIGAECPWTTGVHVLEDLIVLEVVDENLRPVPVGVLGDKILVTTLFNQALPLIRYEISDLVSIAHGPCPCGRAHMRLESINGRREDLLKLPARAGGHINVHAIHLHALLVGVPAIRQFELTPRPDSLLVRVVLKQSDSVENVVQGTGRLIQSELDRLGATARVMVEPVAEIARSGTGAKQKLVGSFTGTHLEVRRR
jgi:phenylacetate-CoA ligase